MPGINLTLTTTDLFIKGQKKIEKILTFMLYEQDYSIKQIIFNNEIYLGITGYSNYPVDLWETEDALIIFEGYCYNYPKQHIKDELSRIAKLCYEGKDVFSAVKAWVFSAVGDYTCLILEKRNQRLCFFNDPMGRLPVYLYKSSDIFAISREVKFITAILPVCKYDLVSVAEALYFGYTLGTNTFVENVQRIEGGTCLTVDLHTLKISNQRTFEFNFDELLDQPVKPIELHGQELVDRFLSACQNIKQTFPDYNIVVSLSGGFDSRSVLAGMKRVKANVAAFSFQDASTATRGADARYAEQVARELGVDWKLYEMPTLSVEGIEELLWVKDGMNFSQMAFLLPLFRRIREDYGPNILHMTGDNGDRSMDPQGPPIKLKNNDYYVDFVIKRHARMRLEDVSAITGFNKIAITEQIRQKLNRYPEKEPNNRYRHFILNERLFNWNFQAEDRNRVYFWHATPFSSLPYFLYAMSVPDSAKKYWKLFHNFLIKINPRCIEVPYANWGAPITSYKRYYNPFKQAIYEQLPAWLRIIIRDLTLYRSLVVDEKLKSYLNQQLEILENRDESLNNKAIQYIASQCNINEFHNILTIVTYIRMHREKIYSIINSCQR